MGARTLTVILLKVLGLWMFSNAVFDLPGYLVGPFDGGIEIPFPQRFAQAVVSLLLPIVFGLLLWFFPGRITNRIVSDAGAPAFATREFERVALTVLGAWLVAYGAVETFGSALSAYFAMRSHPGLPVPDRAFAGPIVALFKVAVGVALMLGARGLQRVLDRIRDQ